VFDSPLPAKWAAPENRMPHDDLWELERGFWLGGLDHFRQFMAPDCVMMLPEVGILAAPAILQGLENAPRWDAIEMTERQAVETGPAVVIAYRGEGRRGAEVYRALCGSAYVGSLAHRQLIQHQQTPLG
jgi:hypothetical protein